MGQCLKIAIVTPSAPKLKPSRNAEGTRNKFYFYTTEYFCKYSSISAKVSLLIGIIYNRKISKKNLKLPKNIHESIIKI